MAADLKSALQSLNTVSYTHLAIFYNTRFANSGYEQTVLNAANFGDDADTIAAISGTIAGARHLSLIHILTPLLTPHNLILHLPKRK